MQYRMTFSCVDLTLPLACQYQVQSMFYALLRSESGYGAAIHPQRGQREHLPFCLGPLEGRKTVDRSRKLISYTDAVTLEVRTISPLMDALLEKVLRPGLRLELCGQPLTLDAVESTQYTIAQSQCRVQMVSPLLAYRRTEGRHTLSYNPLMPEFAAVVEENYRRKYSVWRQDDPGQFSITTESVGLQDKVVTLYKGTWLTGWKGVYRLTGRPEGLSFLYDAGLGQRCGAGFGMFRVLSEGSYQSMGYIPIPL